jgi:hypothetical protein
MESPKKCNGHYFLQSVLKHYKVNIMYIGDYK